MSLLKLETDWNFWNRKTGWCKGTCKSKPIYSLYKTHLVIWSKKSENLSKEFHQHIWLLDFNSWNGKVVVESIRYNLKISKFLCVITLIPLYSLSTANANGSANASQWHKAFFANDLNACFNDTDGIDVTPMTAFFFLIYRKSLSEALE